jgi:predicted GIY-YIG superfamily endonuclease
MEIENEGSLPFLDVLVTKKSNGTLSHAVYRKATHTDRYLNAASHHHPIQKNAVLNTLVNRALAISSEENLKQEKLHLIKTLQQNGYTKSSIHRAIKNQEKNIVEGKDKSTITVREKLAFLPYVKGTSEKIGKVLQKYAIKPVFRPINKIKDILRPVKDKLPLHASGVYHVKCSCGMCYVGETGRLVSTRIKEHIRHTKNCDNHISAIATHSTELKHSIEFDSTKIIASADNYFERKILEAIEIKKHKFNFNRDQGIEISPTWNPIISRLDSKCHPEVSTTDGNNKDNNRTPNNNNPATSSYDDLPESSRSDHIPAPPPYNLRRRPPASSVGL